MTGRGGFRRLWVVLLLSGLVGLPQSAEGADDRPNIVLILADDLGFTDTSPYGGEIATPTIATLAEQGILFTNHHAAASCAPSRAMLLTGVDSHRAGVPNIPEMLPPSTASTPTIGAR